MEGFLEPTLTIESQHPAVIDFVRSCNGESGTPCEQAVRLFYAVRDRIRYDMYRVDVSVQGLRASTTLDRGYGWCVPKATLLAASCRAVGIPARLGFADVRNHLSTERLRTLMKTDIFSWHAWCSMQIDGEWVKASPAFNIELCDHCQLRPIEFDGRADALLPSEDARGRPHMEYLALRGEYDDLPVAAIRETFDRDYPFYAELSRRADFEVEIGREGARAE